MSSKEEVLQLQEKLKTLINGINPFTGEMIKELDLEDSQVIRFMFNLYNVLDELVIKKQVKRREKFVFTQEIEQNIELTDEYISLSKFLAEIRKINNGAVPSYKELTQILVDEGIIQIQQTEDGRTKKVLTDKAQEYEIKEILFNTYYNRQYTAICYNRKGQQFIIELLKKHYSA